MQGRRVVVFCLVVINFGTIGVLLFVTCSIAENFFFCVRVIAAWDVSDTIENLGYFFLYRVYLLCNDKEKINLTVK